MTSRTDQTSPLSGQAPPPKQTACRSAVAHRDPAVRPLPPLLRPNVEVAGYIHAGPARAPWAWL